MRAVVIFIAVLVSIAPVYAKTPLNSGAPAAPSVSATESIHFSGRTFTLKFKSVDQPVRIYEYLHGDDTLEAWMELVEFQVYPVHPGANEPIDFAKRTAAAFQQRYPTLNYKLFEDESTNSVLLDFMFPTSTRREEGKSFLEFNAFKFYGAPGSGNTMAMHYAKNIEGTLSGRTVEAVADDILRSRKEAIEALAAFPAYRE